MVVIYHSKIVWSLQIYAWQDFGAATHYTTLFGVPHSNFQLSDSYRHTDVPLRIPAQHCKTEVRPNTRVLLSSLSRGPSILIVTQAWIIGTKEILLNPKQFGYQMPVLFATHTFSSPPTLKLPYSSPKHQSFAWCVAGASQPVPTCTHSFATQFYC